MKLTLKLAAAFVLGISIMLFFYGVSRVRYAAALLEKDTQRDHLAIGHTLATVVAEAWRTNGRAGAMALVDLANREKSQIAIRWVSLDATAPRAQRPKLPASKLRPVAAGRDLARIREETAGSERMVVAYVPVRVGGAVEGAIELAESLDEERAYIENIITRTVLIAALIAAACGVMALGLGYFMVGRPVGRLVAMARRVGGGDFAGRLGLRQKDELGRLGAEMNQMTECLAETSERLAAETQSRIAAIEQVRHADRLSTVGRLASGMAHELGTPLQVISGRAKLIVREELSAAEAKESAAVIAEQSERITRIIRQLLNFARRRSARKARHDVVPVVENTLAMLEPMATRQGVSLRFDRPEQGVELEVDVSQLQQVLTNLVVNGIQSMSGGGNLKMGIEHKRVRPPPDHGGVEGDCTCIVVEDEGTGIPEEVLPRIFEPFFTTKEVGEGTGLGLSVSYGIVREHGGWIGVENRGDKGSRFSICLPDGA